MPILSLPIELLRRTAEISLRTLPSAFDRTGRGVEEHEVRAEKWEAEWEGAWINHPDTMRHGWEQTRQRGKICKGAVVALALTCKQMHKACTPALRSRLGVNTAAEHDQSRLQQCRQCPEHVRVLEIWTRTDSRLDRDPAAKRVIQLSDILPLVPQVAGLCAFSLDSHCTPWLNSLVAALPRGAAQVQELCFVHSIKSGDACQALAQCANLRVLDVSGQLDDLPDGKLGYADPGALFRAIWALGKLEVLVMTFLLLDGVERDDMGPPLATAFYEVLESTKWTSPLRRLSISDGELTVDDAYNLAELNASTIEYVSVEGGLSTFDCGKDIVGSPDIDFPRLAVLRLQDEMSEGLMFDEWSIAPMQAWLKRASQLQRFVLRGQPFVEGQEIADFTASLERIKEVDLFLTLDASVERKYVSAMEKRLKRAGVKLHIEVEYEEGQGEEEEGDEE